MSTEARLELLFGCIAAVLAAAVAMFTFTGSYVAPDSFWRDLVAFAAIWLALVLGFTLDVAYDWLVGRILLGLGTLLLATTIITGAGIFLLPSIALAAGATGIAFVRPHRQTGRRAA